MGTRFGIYCRRKRQRYWRLFVITLSREAAEDTQPKLVDMETGETLESFIQPIPEGAEFKDRIAVEMPNSKGMTILLSK